MLARAEHRSRHDWNQTSLLAATVFNSAPRAQGSRPGRPADFNPWTEIDGKSTKSVPLSGRALDQLIAECERAGTIRNGEVNKHVG